MAEEEEGEGQGSMLSTSDCASSPIAQAEPIDHGDADSLGEAQGGRWGTQCVDEVKPTIDSRGGRRRGRGKSSHLLSRPSRQELVRLYLLRKRGLDKRHLQLQDEGDFPILAWELAPVANGMDSVSATLEESEVQEKRNMLFDEDEDEQNMPPPKRMRNRVKAQKARDRKMAYLKEMEAKLKELLKKNADLEDMHSNLQNENDLLRNEIMEGDSEGKEELKSYYEILEKNRKESAEKHEELNGSGSLDDDDGEAMDCKDMESSGNLIDEGEPRIGMRFDTESSAREFYAEYAWNVGFSTRTDKCRRSEKDGAIIWRKFVCSKEGFTRTREKSGDGRTRRNRPSTRTGCPAFIEVARKSDGSWAITKFHKEHNHKMFCSETEEWMLSSMTLQENGTNLGAIVAKMDGLTSSVVKDALDEKQKDDELCVGTILDSEEYVRAFYEDYGKNKGFTIRTDKCRRSEKDGAIIWRRFTCSKEGLSRMKEKKDCQRFKRYRPSIRTGCLAFLEATRRTDGKWVVTRFQEEHNHTMLTSSEMPYNQVQRQQIEDKKGLVETRTREDNFRNYLLKMKMIMNADGNDVLSILSYFKHKKNEDHAFFYEAQVESDNDSSNILWVNARARLSYSQFGDMLELEILHINDHPTKFALFSGVNHHNQRILFGCALLRDEGENSLKWLLRTWLKAVSGRHPRSVVTNLDDSMQQTLAKEFPGSHLRYSHWHILAQCKEKLPGLYIKKSVFKNKIKTCINHTDTPEEFEAEWKEVVQRYNLGKNEWILELYDTRKLWVPAYQRDHFFAEFDTAKRRKCIEKLVEQTSLHQFLMQYERIEETLYLEEKKADIKSNDSTSCLKTHSPMESQASRLYTNEVFEIFQEQFAGAFAFKSAKIEDGNDGTTTYILEKYERPANSYTVQFRASDMVASCSCKKFEFSGILCSHVLAVLLAAQKPVLPDHYILKRWTKMANKSEDLDEYDMKCEQAVCDKTLSCPGNIVG